MWQVLDNLKPDYKDGGLLLSMWLCLSLAKGIQKKSLTMFTTSNNQKKFETILKDHIKKFGLVPHPEVALEAMAVLPWMSSGTPQCCLLFVVQCHSRFCFPLRFGWDQVRTWHGCGHSPCQSYVFFQSIHIVNQHKSHHICTVSCALWPMHVYVVSVRHYSKFGKPQCHEILAPGRWKVDSTWGRCWCCVVLQIIIMNVASTIDAICVCVVVFVSGCLCVWVCVTMCVCVSMAVLQFVTVERVSC